MNRYFSDPCNPTTTVVTTLYDRGLIKRGSLFNHDIIDKIEEYYHEWENELEEYYDKDARFLVRVLTKYTGDDVEDKYNSFVHDRDFNEFLEVNKDWIDSLPRLRFQRFGDDYYETDDDFIRVAKDALTNGGKSFLLVRPELKKVYENECNRLNKIWEGFLDQDKWLDHLLITKSISKMSTDYIMNCIKWLDTQKVKKYIPSDELRKAFIAKFKSELMARQRYKELFPSEEFFREGLKEPENREQVVTDNLNKLTSESLKKSAINYTLDKLFNSDGTYKDKKDMVNHPTHYSNKKYEPIAVINDWGLSYNTGNCLKYLSRLGLKDDIKQDINKAIFYLIYEGKELGLTKEQILKTVESVFEKR